MFDEQTFVVAVVVVLPTGEISSVAGLCLPLEIALVTFGARWP